MVALLNESKGSLNHSFIGLMLMANKYTSLHKIDVESIIKWIRSATYKHSTYPITTFPFILNTIYCTHIGDSVIDSPPQSCIVITLVISQCQGIYFKVIVKALLLINAIAVSIGYVLLS